MIGAKSAVLIDKAEIADIGCDSAVLGVVQIGATAILQCVRHKADLIFGKNTQSGTDVFAAGLIIKRTPTAFRADQGLVSGLGFLDETKHLIFEFFRISALIV